MENKENTSRPPPVTTQYARRVLREINTPRVVLVDLPKNPTRNPPATDQIPIINQTDGSTEPGPSQAESIFPDIRPEVFSRERRTLRNLAGRIYLIYCHLCCLDKKFHLSESDISYNSDNEVEEVVVKIENHFFFGKTAEIELEKMVLNTARYSFGGCKTVNESSILLTNL